MSRRADIDLLFGLLALQNGLIDQGTLFAAFATWARDKNRAMAEILVGQGALDPGERALLEGLAEKHLERHGGDSGKSLASLSSIEAVREELSRIGGPDLEASLPLFAASGDADPFRTRTSNGVGPSTAQGDRFQILRPHAAGGLGQVFVARDAELNRDVALKEIRERYADDPRHRRRFEFEAEVTGGLEHPGIVPVYGVGCRADGRPYYAMRFIRGVPLNEAINKFHGEPANAHDSGRRSLELRKLLRRFLDVCNTIEYAHQRGVLHRDLKPHNVMLGKHGETIVVDWGLAKAVGRPASETPLDELTLAPELANGSSETVRGSVIGTPAFMSPEQATGDVDHIGPPSDVYSLGATLYTLLTDKPPFDEKDQGRLLQMVRQGTFPAPRQLDRSIDPALEAICLKAMALAPLARYPSARALADDIDRWMADQPVTARPDPLSTRAARFMRRHRTIAAGTAVFLAVASVSSSVGFWLISGQKAEAIQQRRRAESNLVLARQVVNEMYTRVAAELENVPRMDDYQRTILEKARQFYENDALLQSRDHATRLDAAVTQLRLAYIDQKLGRIDDARDIAGRALELYESMIREKPAGLEQRAGSAEARASLGHIDLQARKFQSSADQFAMAIDQWENLAQTYPAEPSYRLKLGVSLGELGQALLNCHRLDEANKVYGKSLERLEALAVEHPHREDYRRALAAALDNLASLYTEENRDTESEQLRRRALALRRAIENPNSDNVSSRCDIAWGLNNLGYTLVRLQKVAEADVVLSEAITLCERINSDHPDLPKNRIELSKALCHRGTLHRDTDPSKALEFLRRALVIVREVPLNSPDTPQIQSHLAVILYELAFTERAVTLLENRQDTFNDAEGHLREALTTCDQLAKDSNDVAILDLRGQAWLLRGMMSRDRGRIDEALSSFLIAAESHESLVRKVPNEPQFRGHLTIALGEGLGKTYRQLERKAEALASYRRAVQLLGSIEHKDGTDLYNLACSLAQCSALGTQPGAAASNMSPANDAASAVDAFRLAIAAKACTYADVQDDTDLDPLRGRPDFEALVKELVVDRPAASRSGRPGIGTQQGPK